MGDTIQPLRHPARGEGTQGPHEPLDVGYIRREGPNGTYGIFIPKIVKI